MGRGRAREILLTSQDFDGGLAERYGYVNRALPDDGFEAFIDAIARRVASFDKQAIAETKRYVSQVSLPDPQLFPPALDAFWESVARPAAQQRVSTRWSAGCSNMATLSSHSAITCSSAARTKRRGEAAATLRSMTASNPHSPGKDTRCRPLLPGPSVVWVAAILAGKCLIQTFKFFGPSLGAHVAVGRRELRVTEEVADEDGI